MAEQPFWGLKGLLEKYFINRLVMS